MKKLFVALLFITVIAIPLSAQFIGNSIPKFAESLFGHDRTYVEKELLDRAFKLLPTEVLMQYGYDTHNTIAGVGDQKIWCIVELKNSKVKKVLINNVKYPHAKYAFAEYEIAGYTLDAQNATDNQLVYRRHAGEYVYAATINYMVNPYGCLTRVEFTKTSSNTVQRKDYVEQPVDLNDYFNPATGWDEADYNCTDFADDEEWQRFKKDLDKYGIYYSVKKKRWVRKMR